MGGNGGQGRRKKNYEDIFDDKRGKGGYNQKREAYNEDEKEEAKDTDKKKRRVKIQ